MSLYNMHRLTVWMELCLVLGKATPLASPVTIHNTYDYSWWLCGQQLYRGYPLVGIEVGKKEVVLERRVRVWQIPWSRPQARQTCINTWNLLNKLYAVSIHVWLAVGGMVFFPIWSTFFWSCVANFGSDVSDVMIWGHAEDRPEDRSNCRGQFEAWGTLGPEGSHMLNQ